jgi:hypothetical protein
MSRQRRGDLGPDEPRLAHAGDDDPALAAVQDLDRPVEPLAEPRHEVEDRPRLELEDLAGDDVRHPRPLSTASIASTCFRRASTWSSLSAFGPSLFASAGLSCTSQNSPSMPTAAAARARWGM